MSRKHCCVDTVRKELMDQDKTITSIAFDLSTIVSYGPGQTGDYKTGQRIQIYAEHKKRNGYTVLKKSVSFVTHTFCPFCGKKYL